MGVSLADGTRLGPYEIQARIGAGGMGEVYRARDARLGRDVAVKVLPAAFAGDAERLQRFEREARAAGQLNHPNIMAVHDVGSTGDGLPYLVCELIEGATLRGRLEDGPIAPRKAIAYAAQIAQGLAAAHAKGVAHRDLKPENVMVLSGDHVKILDFGLAKLLHAEPEPDGGADTVDANLTRTGAILGTASYMSPEQVRGQETDHRTDLFSFGTILYEMLAGRRAFEGASHADRLSAILGSEPAPLPDEVEAAVPGVSAIIAHCLEKRAGDRFDTARDLAFALALVEATAARVRPTRGRAGDALRPKPSGDAEIAVDSVERALSYRRITFRDGPIHGARFAPDGKAVCYGSSWEGRPVELFWSYPGNPESRALGFVGADLLAIASTGEMAVSLRRQSRGGFVFTGMLARMPFGGGAPREIMDNVWEADFSPDGRRLAIVRDEGGMTRIELPAGTVLYQTPGWIKSARVSPDGTRVAFLDHPNRGNDAGSVAVVDVDRTVKRLSSGWSSMRGLAWSPDGKEVIFAGFRGDAGRGLHAVDLDARERRLLQIPGSMTLADVSRQGSTLILLEHERIRAQYLGAGDAHVRDLSWFDWTLLRAITDDGSRILFDETGVAGGELGASYIRGTDGSPAVRLGDGIAFGLSPDEQWAVIGVGHGRARLHLVPCGAGEPRLIPTGDLEIDHVSWFPDGGSICCLAREPGQGTRLVRIDLATGARAAFSDEGISYYDAQVSPDGRSVAAHGPDRKLAIYPVDGGPRRPISGILEFERTVRWSPQGDALFVFKRGELPAKVWRIDLATGERTLWREILPTDRTGVEGVATIRMTPDGASFAYSYFQRISALYVVEGLFSRVEPS